MREFLRAVVYPFFANLERSEKMLYGLALVIVVSLVVAMFGGLAFLFV